MSRQHFGIRRATLIALSAVAASAVAAAPASAVQEKTLTYKCKYPLIGTNPLSVKISLDIPDTWPLGEPTAPFAVSAVATASGNTVPGLALIEGLAAIEGVSRATATVTVAGATPVAVTVPISIPKYVLPTPVPDPLVLTASGSTPSLTIDDEGPATISIDKLALNLKATDAAGEAIVLPPVTKDIDLLPVKDSDGNPETFDVYCKLDAGQSTVLGGFRITSVPGCSCENPPTNPTVTATPGLTSVALTWSGATDNVGVVGYDVYRGTTLVTSVTGTSATVAGLTAGTSYTFKVVAKDAAGNTSSGGTVTTRTVICDCGDGPTNPTVTAVPGLTSVALAWSGSTDEVGVVGYDVYNGSTLVTSVTGTSATVSGLTLNTVYTFKVVAKDAAGNRSSGGLVTTKTLQYIAPPLPIKYGYTLAGSTKLNTLTKGSLKLKGAIDAELTLATGLFTADLTLAQTQGQLTALGFLPVTAKIGFVPSGKTTGSLLDGVLKTSSLVRIKVQEVKLFGAIPLAGGNNCQTKSLSKIELKSTQAEFSPLDGGPIAGTYAISDLNGCGALNGLVSPLTAGGGNSINAVLTPKA